MTHLSRGLTYSTHSYHILSLESDGAPASWRQSEKLLDGEDEGKEAGRGRGRHETLQPLLVQLPGVAGVTAQQAGHQGQVEAGQAATGHVGRQMDERGQDDLGEVHLGRQHELAAGEEEGAHLGTEARQQTNQHHLAEADRMGEALLVRRMSAEAGQAGYKPQDMGRAAMAEVGGGRPAGGQIVTEILGVLTAKKDGRHGGRALFVQRQDKVRKWQAVPQRTRF